MIHLKRQNALCDSESLVLFDSLNDINVLSEADIASLIESLVDVDSLLNQTLMYLSLWNHS